MSVTVKSLIDRFGEDAVHTFVDNYVSEYLAPGYEHHWELRKEDPISIDIRRLNGSTRKTFHLEFHPNFQPGTSNTDLKKGYHLVFASQVLTCLFFIDLMGGKVPDEPRLNSVSRLMEQVEKMDRDRVVLRTNNAFLEKVTAQLAEAIFILDNFSLDLIANLGGSHNDFVNFFIAAITQGLISEDIDFHALVEQKFGFRIDMQKSDQNFRGKARKLEEVLEKYGFEVYETEFYITYHHVRKSYEKLLSKYEIERPSSWVINDVNVLLHLTNPEKHQDTNKDILFEPVLVTWDTFFLKIRDELIGSMLDAEFWTIYSPGQLAERLSLEEDENATGKDLHLYSLSGLRLRNANGEQRFVDVVINLIQKDSIRSYPFYDRLIELKLDGESEEEEHDETNDKLAIFLLELKKYFDIGESRFSGQDLGEYLCAQDTGPEAFEILEKMFKRFHTKRELADDLLGVLEEKIKNRKIRMDAERAQAD